MQRRFTSPGPVLNEKGQPNAGWASGGILRYNRAAIKAPFYRIKEWDWYQVNNSHLALQFTFGHASYAGQVGVMLFDFKTGEKIFNHDEMLICPFASLGLGASADEDGTLVYNKKGMEMRLETCGDTRLLYCRCAGLEAEITLIRQTPQGLVINVPFDEAPTAFYYNHKISCMRALGRVVANGREYLFDEDAWGLLDWGRGVWPFHNAWYWASAAGRLGGEVFGFNLGCGFGNTGTATENCLFYQDTIHKLGTVRFVLGASYNDPWHLVDEEGRLDLTLTPCYDRETKTKILWVDNNTHQMFGEFAGYAVLDDGTRLTVEKMVGFAEHAVNNW